MDRQVPITGRRSPGLRRKISDTTALSLFIQAPAEPRPAGRGRGRGKGGGSGRASRAAAARNDTAASAAAAAFRNLPEAPESHAAPLLRPQSVPLPHVAHGNRGDANTRSTPRLMSATAQEILTLGGLRLMPEMSVFLTKEERIILADPTCGMAALVTSVDRVSDAELLTIAAAQSAAVTGGRTGDARLNSAASHGSDTTLHLERTATLSAHVPEIVPRCQSTPPAGVARAVRKDDSSCFAGALAGLLALKSGEVPEELKNIDEAALEQAAADVLPTPPSASLPAETPARSARSNKRVRINDSASDAALAPPAKAAAKRPAAVSLTTTSITPSVEPPASGAADILQVLPLTVPKMHASAGPTISAKPVYTGPGAQATATLQAAGPQKGPSHVLSKPRPASLDAGSKNALPKITSVSAVAAPAPSPPLLPPSAPGQSLTQQLEHLVQTAAPAIKALADLMKLAPYADTGVTPSTSQTLAQLANLNLPLPSALGAPGRSGVPNDAEAPASTKVEAADAPHALNDAAAKGAAAPAQAAPAQEGATEAEQVAATLAALQHTARSSAPAAHCDDKAAEQLAASIVALEERARMGAAFTPRDNANVQPAAPPEGDVVLAAARLPSLAAAALPGSSFNSLTNGPSLGTSVLEGETSQNLTDGSALVDGSDLTSLGAVDSCFSVPARPHSTPPGMLNLASLGANTWLATGSREQGADRFAFAGAANSRKPRHSTLKHDGADERTQQRRARNRDAARRTRLKKLLMLQGGEQKVMTLAEDVQARKSELQSLQQQVEEAQACNANLKSRLALAAAPETATST